MNTISSKTSTAAPADVLGWLQYFFSSNCDGDWEHQYGVEISTTDNPGWYVKMDLAETEHSELMFPEEKIERSSEDWVMISIKERVLFGAGGRSNLLEILTLMRAKLCS
jgi:hypothetical protein